VSVSVSCPVSVSVSVLHIASAYASNTHGVEAEKDPLFVEIWSWNRPERIRTFLWKLAANDK